MRLDVDVFDLSPTSSPNRSPVSRNTDTIAKSRRSSTVAALSTP